MRGRKQWLFLFLKKKEIIVLKHMLQTCILHMQKIKV